ncbi:MAG: hypothetical protein IIY90_03105, partial [Oscillospiraceae bacterium]|nr:hypothetical protein [Oscillospiraceae bacterium]
LRAGAVREGAEMKRLLLVINPVTARSAVTPALIDVIDCFEKGGYAVTTHVTQRKNDTQETVKSIGEQFDTVVCAGGDGTLNETVSAVLELGRKPKVGYIPAGTTNDFAVSWCLQQGHFRRHPWQSRHPFRALRTRHSRRSVRFLYSAEPASLPYLP